MLNNNNNNNNDIIKNDKLEKCKKLLSLRLAPLASFEDLPTDDQKSSNSSSSSSNDNDNDDDGDEDGKQQRQQHQITVLITDHDRNNNDEQMMHEPPPPILNNENMLMASNKTQQQQQRKGSWTDIFLGRKSPIPKKERKFSLFSFKFSSFKDDNKQSTNIAMNIMDQSSRLTTPLPPVFIDCGIQITSDNDLNMTCQSTTSNDDDDDTTTVVYVDDSSSKLKLNQNNIVPIINYDNNQDDIDSLCSLCNNHHQQQQQQQQQQRQYNDDDYTTTTTECSECETNHSCSECDYETNYESTDVDMIADHEDNDDQQQQQCKDSNEMLEMLVINDELDDLNRIYVNEEIINKSNRNDKMKYKERQRQKEEMAAQKLSITTLPIVVERPHSIVPVTNLKKFEAFIENCTNNDNNNINDDNKLRITLPIDNQSGKCYDGGNSRKSNPFIWLQFCEQGLIKNPKIFRKRAKSCFPSLTSSLNVFQFDNINLNDPFLDYKNDDDTKSPENLTPITPLKNIDNDDDDDLFKINDLIKKQPSKNQSSIECQHCNTCSDVNTSIVSNLESSLTTCSEITTSDDESLNRQNSIHATTIQQQQEDEPLLLSCNCQCHHHHHHSIASKISNPVSKNDETPTKLNELKLKCSTDEIYNNVSSLPSSSSTTTLSSSTSTSTSKSSPTSKSPTSTSTSSSSVSVSVSSPSPISSVSSSSCTSPTT